MRTMRWKHTLAICAALFLVCSIAWAAVTTKFGSIVLTNSSPSVKSTGNTVSFLDSTGEGYVVNAGIPQIFIAGAAAWQFYNTYFIPITDAAESVGLSSNRVSVIWEGNDAVGSTQTAGMTMSNNTPATAGVDQNSPAIKFVGHQWLNTAVDSAITWYVQAYAFDSIPQAGMFMLLDQLGAGAINQRAAFQDVGGGNTALYLGSVASNDYIYGGGNVIVVAPQGTPTIAASPLGVSVAAPSASTSVFTVDQGNLTNITGISLANAGPGTTGISYSTNSYGSWGVDVSGGVFNTVSANNSQHYEVRNEAFSGSDYAYLMEASSLSATKTFMRWMSFAGQTGPILEIQNSTPTTIASISATGVFKSPEFVSLSTAPALASGANAYFGTLASTSVTGTNDTGYISFTTGTLGSAPTGQTAANAEVLKITFSGSFTAPTGCTVQWFPMGIDNDTAAKNWAAIWKASTITGDFLWGVCSTTTCSMYLNVNAPANFANATAYRVGYKVSCY